MGASPRGFGDVLARLYLYLGAGAAMIMALWLIGLLLVMAVHPIAGAIALAGYLIACALVVRGCPQK